MGRRIAFYAPMKAPDHPVPSGDRRMARLFMAALAKAGFDVELAADFRAYDGSGDGDKQARLRQLGEALAERLISGYRAGDREAPALWFTYHLYHKAPDWLGPRITEALGIPYVIAEASDAPKQAGGAWDLGYQAAARAIVRADRVLCMTGLDLACVRRRRAAASVPALFPPFIDCRPFAAAASARAGHRQDLARRHGLDPAAVWLLVVAMMRRRDKLGSYQILAAALEKLGCQPGWQLIIAGDGEAMAEVRRLFAPLANRVKLVGALAGEQLPAYYAAADLYAWPAINEAYGMAFLEAQAAGTAVLAGAGAGVGDVVYHGDTGLLTPAADVDCFAAAAAGLIGDPARRRRMGEAAAIRMRERHDIAIAAKAMARLLEPLIG